MPSPSGTPARKRFGVSSLKEVNLSRGFSRFFRCFFAVFVLLGTYFLRRSRRLHFVSLRRDALGRAFQDPSRNSSVDCSRSCHRVRSQSFFTLRLHPKSSLRGSRLPYGKRSSGLESGHLTQYCSLRPSCEAKLVPIRVTSHCDCSRGIYDTPRTEQGPQGS